MGVFWSVYVVFNLEGGKEEGMKIYKKRLERRKDGRERKGKVRKRSRRGRKARSARMIFFN